MTNPFEEETDAAKESVEEGVDQVDELKRSGGDVELKKSGGDVEFSGGDVEFGDIDGDGDEGTDSGGDVETAPRDLA